MNFEYKINSKNEKSENLFFIRFSTVRIFHADMATSEEGGGVHILRWEKSIHLKRMQKNVHQNQCKKILMLSPGPGLFWIESP